MKVIFETQEITKTILYRVLMGKFVALLGGALRDFIWMPRPLSCSSLMIWVIVSLEILLSRSISTDTTLLPNLSVLV
jgi:hypothetical protein